MKVHVKPLSRIQIRKIANELREISGFKNIKRFPIVHFIEWVIGDPNSPFNFEIVEFYEMPETYAVTDLQTGTIRIREDVYERAIAGYPRDLFTLFHELGHCILHQAEDVMFARGDVPAYRNPEWQADCFAAELMAPYHLARGMSAKQIAKEFGMSMQAAGIRSEECF